MPRPQVPLNRAKARSWASNTISCVSRGYSNARKAPRTRKAGPGYVDPDYDLAADWIAARNAIEEAQKRHDDPARVKRVLLINGSSRSDQTCPAGRCSCNALVLRPELALVPQSAARYEDRMSARAPASIFLVEDEPMIRMLVVEMLEELGYSVIAEAGDISAALGLARTIECDLAILDVNIDGHVISPVAELLRTRQIPIIFATGYDSSSLPEVYRDLPALQKPFQIAALERLVGAVLRQAQT